MGGRSDSEFGGESAGSADGVGDKMNPKQPTQAELDADRAANPDTSKQVDPTDPGSQAGGGSE